MPFTAFRRSIHRISTGWFRAALVAGAATFLLAPEVRAQDAGAGLYRVFLKDGRVLTAYGEWARLDDSVVFSMPTRRGDPAAELHIVTLKAADVDWERTQRYATALQAQNYAATRGEADFARLGDDVARTLNDIATVKDPAERLARAELARKTLNEWPGAHYAYRAVEVREILGLLDEVIADLRAKVGQSGTNLALVAPPPVLPDEPLLPEPSEAEMVEQLMTAAQLAQTPAERTSLLQTLLGLLDRAVGMLPDAWAGYVRGEATAKLAEEQRLDRAYAELRTTTLASAAKSAARADVRALERLRRAVLEADTRLGSSRPADVIGLMAALDAQLEAARSMQLARDQWELRAPARPQVPALRDAHAAGHQSPHPRAGGRPRAGGAARLASCSRCSIAGAATARGSTASRRPRTWCPSTRCSAARGRWGSRRSRCGCRPRPPTTRRARNRPRPPPPGR